MKKVGDLPKRLIDESVRHGPYIHEYTKKYSLWVVFLLPWLLYKEMTRPTNDYWHQYTKEH